MNVGWPVFTEAKDDVSGGDNHHFKAISRDHHHKPTSSYFTGQMPFLLPNQQCQSTEGKNITFHGLAYPKLTWGLPTLSLTTNSSWLPWGRVTMPLSSPLMPVPQSTTNQSSFTKTIQRCQSLTIRTSTVLECLAERLTQTQIMLGL